MRNILNLGVAFIFLATPHELNTDYQKLIDFPPTPIFDSKTAPPVTFDLNTVWNEEIPMATNTKLETELPSTKKTYPIESSNQMSRHLIIASALLLGFIFTPLVLKFK